MIDEKLINRINALSRKKKSEPLSSEEQHELEQLRKEYLKQFRMGFEQTIRNVKVIDQNGNDVTPKKGKA